MKVTPPRKRYKVDETGVTLMAYQKTGVQRIVRAYCSDTYETVDESHAIQQTRAFLLFDDMGLGKTMQALEAQRQMLPRLTRPSLVVGPASCIHVWKHEAEKHFAGVFDVRMFIGAHIVPRVLQNLQPNTLIITSYTTLRNAFVAYVSNTLPLGKLDNQQLLKLCQVYCTHHKARTIRPLYAAGNRSELLKIAKQYHTTDTGKLTKSTGKYGLYRALMCQRYGVLIMDEAHMLKNMASKTTKAVAYMMARYRLALTGTPVMNGGSDLLSILRYGLNLFDANWKEIHANPNGAYCKTLRSTIMLGRKKTQIAELQRKLPTRNRALERVCLRWEKYPLATRMYVRVRNASVVAYTQVYTLRRLPHESQADFMARRTVATQCFWSKFQRLRQICLHPRLPHYYVDPHVAARRAQRIEPSAKMEAFYRLYCQTQGHKVVAVSHSRVFLQHLLGPWLTQQGVPNILFAGGARKRQEKTLRAFRNQQEIRVLLIVKRAGAHGLNLQDVASTCVLFDPHFNEALDEQAVQRIDRLNQISDKVIVRKLYMQGSVDEAMYMMQDKKTEKNNAWLGRNNHRLSLDMVGMFLSKYDRVGL